MDQTEEEFKNAITAGVFGEFGKADTTLLWLGWKAAHEWIAGEQGRRNALRVKFLDEELEKREQIAREFSTNFRFDSWTKVFLLFKYKTIANEEDLLEILNKSVFCDELMEYLGNLNIKHCYTGEPMVTEIMNFINKNPLVKVYFKNEQSNNQTQC